MSLGAMIPLLSPCPDHQSALATLLNERARLKREAADTSKAVIFRVMAANRLSEIDDAIVKMNGGSDR